MSSDLSNVNVSAIAAEAWSRLTTSSTATSTRHFVHYPAGRLLRGCRVKEIGGIEAYPDEVHPGKRHTWREVLHYGQVGTGYVTCGCGAYGVPYKRPRWKVA